MCAPDRTLAFGEVDLKERALICKTSGTFSPSSPKLRKLASDSCHRGHGGGSGSLAGALPDPPPPPPPQPQSTSKQISLLTGLLRGRTWLFLDLVSLGASKRLLGDDT